MSSQPPQPNAAKWSYVPRKVVNIPILNFEQIKKQLQQRTQELEESLNPTESSESEEDEDEVYLSDVEKEPDDIVDAVNVDQNKDPQENKDTREVKPAENHCNDAQSFRHHHLTTVLEEPSYAENEHPAENKENLCNYQSLEPLNLSKDFHLKTDSFCEKINKKNDSFDLDFSALTIITPVKKKPEAIIRPKINIIPSTPKNSLGANYSNKLQTPMSNKLSQNHYSLSKPMFKTPQNKPLLSYSAKKLPTPFQNLKRTPMNCRTLPETVPHDNNYGPVRSCNFREEEFTRISVNHVEYLVMNILGRGGSSEVFHCFNPDTRQHVAVKCVSLSSPDTATGYINEVKLLESLQKCDKIIKMHSYELVQEEEKLLVVLEKGSEDLSAILKKLATKQNHLPMYMVIFYWMEMLYAVQQIHMNGVIHSDLKPANFLRAEGGLKLIDFGIASKVQEDMTCVYKSYQEGSSNYISPEAVVCQSTGQGNSPTFGKPKYKVHYKSDVWSLGCILYQLVYRNTPFQHINPLWAKFSAITNPNHRIEYPPCDWVSPRIVNTVKKCLQYDIKSRPSVSELIKEYEGILNHI